MNESVNPNSSLSRRDLLKSGAASLAFAAGAQIPTRKAAAAPTGDNPITKENAKPGTKDWLLTNTYIDPDTWWRSPRIEGYCSETSVSAGDKLK
ncbi:MAG: hypothetical protein IH892_12185, partial [Planctomycetes bacterium]|nr:hypothetical protein [Planctomycetota bacterium]